MQSERSRCCHVTERARAARRERANAWTTIFPNQCPGTTFFLFFFLSFFFLLFFRFLLLIPRFLSAFTPCSPALHHSRANANESHLPSVFANVYEGREKNVPSLSAMSFLSGIRGILTRTISRARARARCAKSESRIEAFSNDWPDK